LKKTYQSHLALLVANTIYGLNYVIAKGIMPDYLMPKAIIFIRVIITASFQRFHHHYLHPRTYPGFRSFHPERTHHGPESAGYLPWGFRSSYGRILRRKRRFRHQACRKTGQNFTIFLTFQRFHQEKAYFCPNFTK